MKQFKRVMATLLCLVMTLGLFAGLTLPASAADYELVYTLDGTITGGSNGYATDSSITQSSITWSVTANTTTNPWRFGGKNLTSIDRAASSGSSITGTITKVDIEVGTKTLSSVNNVRLIVASDSSFSTVIEEQSKSYSANSTLSYTPSAGKEWKNAYYKIVFNVTAGSSNQYVQFKNAKFYKDAASSKTLDSIALSGTYTTTFPQGGTFNHTGMTVTATYSDSTTADVTSNASWSSPDMSTTGSQTVTVSYTEGSVTKTATYTITVQATPTHTLSSSVSPSGGGSVSLSASTVAEGATATATATPAAGYDFTSWSISGAGASLSSTSANPTTVTMGTANATVTANFTAKTVASITLSEAGTTSTPSGTHYVGDSYPLPDCTAANTPDGYTFMGWSASRISGSSNTAPSDLKTAGTPVTLTASQTFYAVYAIGSGTGNAGWYLIDDYTNLEDGTYALITPNNYAFNGTISSGHGQKTDDAFSWDANGYSSTAPTGTLELTFTSTANGFTLYDETLGYLYASKASSGGLAFHASEDSGWSFSADGGLYAANSAHLRCYNDTFRTYAGNSNATVGLAVKKSGASYSGYQTDFVTLYAITAATNPANKGTITVAASAAEGANVSLSIADIPTGYHFVNWTGSYNGGTALTISNNTNPSTASFTMPAYAVSITANVALDTHTLTVNSDPASHGTITKTVGGNTTALTTFDYGTNVTLTVSNIDSSWNFTGWSITKGGSTTADANTSVTVTMDADVTVTANYSQTPSYTITTQTSPANSGTITASVGGNAAATAEQGQTVNLSITGIAEHYHFVNWTGSNSLSISNNTNATGASFTMPGSDVTVTANLALDQHTLTVVATNGSVDLDEKQDNVTEDTGTFTYTYGDTETLTAEEHNGNYTFTGWTVSGLAAADYSISGNTITLTMTGDATVTANYELRYQMDVGSPAEITIHATPAGNSAVNEGGNLYVAPGTTVTLTYTGLTGTYNFTSWDVYQTGASGTKVTVSGSGSGATFTMPSYPVTVTAVVTEKPQYTVTYSVDGATNAIAPVTVHQGESVTLPASGATGLAASVTDGANTYDTFVGWTTAEITSETDEAPTILTGTYNPTANVTLYAVYTRSSGGGGGTTWNLVESAPSDWKGDYVISNPNFTSVMIADGSVTGTSYSTANAVSTMTNAGITYDSTSKTLSGVTDAYTFEILDSATSGKYYVKMKGASSDLYLFNNSTSGSTSLSTMTTTGTNADWSISWGTSSPYFVGAQSRYMGWNSSYFRAYAESNKDTYTFQLFKKTGGGTTYYVTAPVEAARWTISYAAASGDTGVTGLPASHSVIQGQATTVSSTVPTREGYEFVNWMDEDSGNEYDPGDSITPTADVTLYAQWAQVYTVTFNSDGGSTVAAQNVVSGGTATQPADPTKDGYTFAGWTLSGSAYNFSTAVTGNITLTATWTGYTWTIYDNGSSVGSGNGPTTLPSAPSGTITNDGHTYTFYKWGVVATDISSPTTTAPTAMYDAGASFTPTANGTIIRAVYTYDAEGGGGGGTEPSAAFAAGDTGTYVIAVDTGSGYIGLPNNPTVSSGKIAADLTSNAVTVSETTGGIKYVTNANAAGYKWTIASDGNGYYTIEDAGNTGNYIYHSNGGASGTNLGYGSTASYSWSFTVDSGAAVQMAGVANSTVNGRGILYQAGSVNKFGGYSLGNWSANDYYQTVILPIGGAGSTTTNYLTLGSVVLNDDVVLLTYGQGAVTINVKANDLGVGDGDTVALDDTYTGFSVSADGKSIVFDPAAITGGFTAPVTATYTISSYSADVTVKPAERIFYEENSGLFNFVDGKRGQWQDDSGEATTTQTLTGENGVWRTADDTAYTSLGYSGGRIMGVYVSSAVTDSTQTSTWPYVEFTFAGTGFEAIASTSNTTGSIMYEVHQGTSTSGTLVGKRTIVDTYQGASYDGSEWSATGNTVNYYQIPIIKVDNLSYGTYTVRISASYATAYDHAGAGGYNFVFDGARIFNPVEGDTAPYLYRSFRDAVTTANSIGVVPDSSNVAATFYVDGVAKPAIAQSVAADTSITLPTLTDSDLSSFDAKTYHFYGWLVGTDLDNDTTTAPTANFYAGGASYTLSADTNFYAVCYYEETGSGNGGDYVKLVSGDEVTSGVYLIVCEGDSYAISKAFDGSLGVSNIDAADNNISVTVDTSGTTPKIASTSTVDASTFTIDAATGTIYSAGGTYIGQSSDANGMLHTANGNYANDISIDSSDNAVIIGSGNAHLRFNNGSSDQRFRYYKSSTYSAQTAIQLYKKEGATATTYVTDLLEVVPQSLTLSGDVTNGGTLNLEVGDTASVTATLTTALRKSTNIAFSTSPSGIVTLGGSGNTRSINAVAVGTTTVTAVCTGDNTIRASFTVNVSASSVKYGYTLNLMENSTAVTPLTATNQTTGTYTFTLPSSVDSANTPSGYTFAGWVATEYTGDNSYSGTSAGLTTSTGYIAPGGEYTMEGVANDTATATLYALYTKSQSVSASDNDTYQMVTSDSFSTSDTYVLAALKDSRFYFVTGTATSGSLGVESTGLASTALTGNTTFVATSLPSGAKALKVTAASGAKGIYYTVYDEDLSADVDYYLYATASKDSLSWSSENTSETFTPNFTQNSTDGCVLTGSSGSKVSYNSSVSDFTKFIRNYTSAGSFYTDLYFFKFVEGSGSGYVTNYYFTTGTSSSSGGNGGAEGRGLTQAQVDALYTSTSQTLTVGSVSKTGFSNWGSRGEWATFLTTPAQSYYTGNYAIDTLLQNSGGTSVSNFASSDLFSVLHSMLVAKHTTHGSYDVAKPILGLADCVENDTTQVSSLYDGEMIATSAFGVSGTGWNREHCWPQSKLSATNAKNDPYLLRAEGQTTNSARGNTAYGKSSGYYYPNLGSTYDVRGDVARIVMYVYTEYQESLLWGSSGVMESLDVMYEWMCADPVDTWEMGRNDVVEQFTGVRNPYVDYPELFFALFGYNIPANYRTPSAYYSSATSPASAFGGAQAPTSGEDESIPMEGNSVGHDTQTRGVNRTVTVEGNAFTGAAVMVNGMGAVSNVEDFLTYGPKNELYLAQGNAIVVYVSGRASEVAIGAKALNGSATQLSVYTINGDDSLTSVLTGATEGKVSVASACERYYPITVSDIYDSGTHAERSKILLIYNPNTNPVSLTNLRVNSSSNATLAVSTGSVTRAVRAVRALHDGTAEITNGGNDTPIIPITNPVAVLTGASLSLEGLIGVNFYLTVPSQLVNNGCYFTVNGERAALEKVGDDTTSYRVTARVAAKEMNDELVLKFFDANGNEKTFGQGSKTNLVSSYAYAVRYYIEAVEEDASQYDADLVRLCKAMNAYGSYAQAFFGYGTGAPIDASTAAAIDAITIGENEYAYTYGADTAHIVYYGESVVTESETAIRFYFLLNGEQSDYAVTVNGEAGSLVKSGKYYYVEISNIAAKDLAKGNTVTVTYGGESLTVDGYSVYTYVRRQLNSSDAALVRAVKAMKYYGDCAIAYFAEEGN